VYEKTTKIKRGVQSPDGYGEKAVCEAFGLGREWQVAAPGGKGLEEVVSRMWEVGDDSLCLLYNLMCKEGIDWGQWFSYDLGGFVDNLL